MPKSLIYQKQHITKKKKIQLYYRTDSIENRINVSLNFSRFLFDQYSPNTLTKPPENQAIPNTAKVKIFKRIRLAGGVC